MNINLDIVELENADLSIGAKGILLQRAKFLGYNIPETYAISSEYLEKHIANHISVSTSQFMKNDRYNTKLLSRIEDLLKSTKVFFKYPNFKDISSSKYKFIVRSSSIVSSSYSSAISGAFQSYPVHNLEDLNKAILNVWKSTFSRQAYDSNQIIPKNERAKGMGVLIQPFINPFISGIMHCTKPTDPISLKVNVSWINGHLSDIVSGDAPGNHFELKPNKRMGTIIIGQNHALKECLSLEVTKVFDKLLDTAKNLLDDFNYGLEVEWVYRAENLWLVQLQELL